METPEEQAARWEAENAVKPLDDRRDLRALRFVSPLSDQFSRFHADLCAICAIPWRIGELVTDHCHATGQVRGRLCRGCNVSEGKSDHPIFVRYRRIHPASIIGMHVMYTGIGWNRGWSLVQHRSGAYTRGVRPPTPWPAWSKDDPLDMPLPEGRS